MSQPSSRAESFAAIAVGAVAMTVVQAQPLLHGQSQSQPWPLLAELAAMGLTVALLGTFHPPRRLRMLGVVAAMAYAIFNLANAFYVFPWPALTVLRALAGVPAGALVWLTVGWIARQARPEPWAAGFFLSQALGGLVFVTLLGAMLTLPEGGWAGGMIASALLTLAAIPAALRAPDTRGPLAAGPWPSPRGLIGLLALLLYVTASSGVWYRMGDFAAAAGLADAPRGYAVVATLVGQMAGATLAVALAGRIRFALLFAVVAALTLGAWALLLTRPSEAVFVAAFGVSGFAGMALGVSLFSFLIEAEPSRRAAAISASAQLVGGALGPTLGLPLEASAALVLASAAVVFLLMRSQRMALGAGRP